MPFLFPGGVVGIWVMSDWQRVMGNENSCFRGLDFLMVVVVNEGFTEQNRTEETRNERRE